MARKRPSISFFDVDGPLKGGSISSWPNFLAERGLFKKSVVGKCEQDIRNVKAGKVSYTQMTIDILNHMAEGLKGKRVAEVKRAFEEFARTPEVMQMHPYAIELVERMNQRGITVAITGQPHELAEAFMKVLPFHISIGTEFGVTRGRYTGKVKRNMALEKGAFVRELKRHRNYWRYHSYSFADRKTDTNMMTPTKTRIAMNPDARMERFARRKGWKVAKGRQILRMIRRRPGK